MTKELIIRPAIAADAAAITQCVESAYVKYIDRIGKPPGPMREDYTTVIDNHCVYVASFDPIVIGVLVLKTSTQGLLLDNVAVDPQYQGMGVGKRLIDMAEAIAKGQGWRRLWLYTHALMTENVGYEEMEQRLENGYQRIYMKKSL